MKVHISSRKKQEGAVLAVTLILLAVATLLGVASMNSGIMQERMHSNQNNKAESQMAAETGGADLISWINDNGWPDDSENPGDEAVDVDADADGSAQYRFISNWTGDCPLNVLVQGQSVAGNGGGALAQTNVLVRLRNPDVNCDGVTNAPAAVSCMGGACNLTAGSGQGADVGFGVVSGFDHPVPDLGCTGAGCRLEPKDTDTPAVPAAFFDDPDHSSLDGNPNHNPFMGLAGDGEGIADSLADAGVGSDAPMYEDGAPTWEDIFGGQELTTDIEDENGYPMDPDDLGGNETGVGTWVLDGEHQEVFGTSGTSLFVGQIIIKNCATLEMDGNPDVYGAIIIDAEGCDEDYDPFKGGGTPAVRYSAEALERVAPGGGNTQAIRWRESLGIAVDDAEDLERILAEYEYEQEHENSEQRDGQ